MTDLVSGTVDLLVVQGAVALPQIRGGKIKAIANLSPQRSASMPDIPTADDRRARTLYVRLVRVLRAEGDAEGHHRQAQCRDRRSAGRSGHPAGFTDIGLNVASREQQTPEGLAAFQKTEIAKWWPIIKAAGIVPGGVQGGDGVVGMKMDGKTVLITALRRRRLLRRRETRGVRRQGPDRWPRQRAGQGPDRGNQAGRGRRARLLSSRSFLARRGPENWPKPCLPTTRGWMFSSAMPGSDRGTRGPRGKPAGMVTKCASRSIISPASRLLTCRRPC